MLIGCSTAGKTTLCQRINHEDLRYNKTQTVQIYNQALIDTPGEYIQRMYFRGALQVTAVDADVVALVQDASTDMTWFPPSYNTQFGKLTIGIVTKSDLATPEQIESAKGYLKMAGARDIFVTSSVSGDGIERLLKFLEQEEREGEDH